MTFRDRSRPLSNFDSISCITRLFRCSASECWINIIQVKNRNEDEKDKERFGHLHNSRNQYDVLPNVDDYIRPRGSTLLSLSTIKAYSPNTALNPYLHVRFKNTATFFSVLDAHMMYKSIAKDCKIICMALFFQIMKYRLLYFSFYCKNGLILLITFIQMGENTCRWSHLIDLLKSFPNVTNFL